MISLKIKTIWQGKVGIREKYLVRARRHNEDILIVKSHEQMLIPVDKLQSLIVGRSDKPFKDKFHGEKHYLFYFLWKPTIKQTKLL